MASLGGTFDAAKYLRPQYENDNELQNALKLSIKSLAVALLGERNKRQGNSREWRWGNNGSLAVLVQGPKVGSWNSKEDTSLGGGPLQLIAYVKQAGRDAAREWARNWLNLPSNQKPALPQPSKVQDKSDDAEKATALLDARRLWDTSKPIEGTLAERYLTDARGIPCPPQGWPDTIRFHPGPYPFPALIVAATDSDGAIAAVQRVFINPDSTKISAQQAALLTPATAKRTRGPVKGTALRLSGDPNGPLLLAEGPETGLSIWAATGAETWVVLGVSGFQSIPLPANRRIILCRDDDKRNQPADKTTEGFLTSLRNGGIDFAVALPWEQRRFDKSDFNDVLKEYGVDAVREIIEKHSSGAIKIQNERKSLYETQDAMCETYTNLFRSVMLNTEPSRACGVRVDVGTGKSIFARYAAICALQGMRPPKYDVETDENGDKILHWRDDGGDSKDHKRIVFFVPTLKLAREAADDFNKIWAWFDEKLPGIWHEMKSAVWLGRAQDDPDSPGNKMCLNLEAVQDALKAGVSVQSNICYRLPPRGTVGTPYECPFYDRCGYQRQYKRKADVWFMTHEYIFLTKPETIGEVAMVVIDESCWQTGLEGIEKSKTITLALDDLNSIDTIPLIKGGYEATEELIALRRKAFEFLQSEPDGPLRRNALIKAGLTADDAARAIELEKSRRSTAGLEPGMPDADRKVALARNGKHNVRLNRLLMLWKAIEATVGGNIGMSGWATLTNEGSATGPVRVVMLKGRKAIGDGWNVPTLLMDANLKPNLVKQFWPGYQTALDIRTATPNQHVRQFFAATGFSKDWLSDDDHLRTVLAVVNREIDRTMVRRGRYRGKPSGGVLIIGNKDVTERIPTLWMRSEAVEMTNFNATAGRDVWKDVSVVFIIGSPNPPTNTAEMMAEALTGEHVPPMDWYERRLDTVRTTGGKIVPVEADYHPNPTTEEIRRDIRAGEIEQAIGRGRGVQRKAEEPVDIFVMSPVPLPYEVTVMDNDAMDVAPLDLMLSVGGLAFKDSPTHAARCFPDLWENAEAAQKAFQRAGEKAERMPPCEDDIPLPFGLTVDFRYQLRGARQKVYEGRFYPSRMGDPERWLTDRLGALALFDLVPVENG